MGNTVSELHEKFHWARLIRNCSNGRHTLVCIYASICRKSAVYKDWKTNKNGLHFFSGFLENQSWGMLIVRKLHVKFHRATLIRRRFKLQGIKIPTKKHKQPKIVFMEWFWHIAKSRKNESFFGNAVFGKVFAGYHDFSSVLNKGRQNYDLNTFKPHLRTRCPKIMISILLKLI